MISNSKSLALSEPYFDNEEVFTLGLRELLFLASILLIGFCGFTVCVDKIYSVSQDANQIESISVHNKDLSLVTPSAIDRPYTGYSLSIEN